MLDIDPRWLKIAKADLPCDYYCSHRKTVPEHSVGCPAYYRPIFAQRLQEAVEAERKWVVEKMLKLFIMADEELERLYKLRRESERKSWISE